MNESHACRSSTGFNERFCVLGNSIGWNWRVKIEDFEMIGG